MARTVLVIGAQGVLGTFMARAFRDAGWEVTRGGRRPETAADFRLVDFDRPQTVADSCAEVDLVVSAVRERALKNQYDPRNFFHLNQLIKATAA